MADIPSVPPAQPVTPQASLSLSGIPVRQAPQPAPAVIQGIVLSSDPKAQEIHIRTSKGEVVLQSPQPLPPGTGVSVEIYMDKTRLRANITILRQSLAMSQELEKILTPEPLPAKPAPPPLREGISVTALLLPEEPQIQLRQIAAVIEGMKRTDLGKINLPLPPELLKALAATPDVEKFLKNLPPRQLEMVARTVNEFSPLPPPLLSPLPVSQDITAPAAPDIISRLLAAYLPQFFSKADSAATPGKITSDTLDNNLLQIIRAQMHARTTLQSKSDTENKPAPPPPNFRPLAPLMSFPLPDQSGPVAPDMHLQDFIPLPKIYKLEILQILPPGTPPEQVTAVLQKIPQEGTPPQQGEIEARTSEGLPIIRTKDSHFVIKTPFEVPPRSIVVFKAAALTPEQIISDLQAEGVKYVPAAATRDFDPLHDSSWPALQEALKTLTQAGEAQPLRNVLPAPSKHLAPAMLFFLTALRRGALENWLGDNVLKALRQTGGQALTEKMGSDFSRLSTRAQEPLADNWRALSLPLLHEDQLGQVQIYVRQQQDQEHGRDANSAKDKPATRFILNLNLSRLGEMQLDGFIQKKNFDVVLRTQEKLPFDMRQEIMKRFAEGLGQVQMQGGISFQARKQGWITVELPQREGFIA